MLRYKIKKKRDNMCYNGIMLLRCELSYPTVGVCESFFEEICEKCLSWAKEKLYPRLSEEYDNDTDPKKRFTCGYEYRVCIEEKENFEDYVKFVFLSTVKKRGSRENLFERESDFTVRLSDGSLIPETLLKKLKNGRINKKSQP